MPCMSWEQVARQSLKERRPDAYERLEREGKLEAAIRSAVRSGMDNYSIASAESGDMEEAMEMTISMMVAEMAG